MSSRSQKECRNGSQRSNHSTSWSHEAYQDISAYRGSVEGEDASQMIQTFLECREESHEVLQLPVNIQPSDIQSMFSAGPQEEMSEALYRGTDFYVDGRIAQEVSRKRAAPTSSGAELPTLEKKRKYQCNQCGSLFNNRKEASEHRRVCAKLYKCQECEYSTPYEKMLKRHQAKHVGRTCVECNLSFRSGGAFNKHKQVHRNRGKIFPCTMCEKKYTSADSLYGHVSKVHAFRGEVECRYCFRRFKTEQGMLIHVSRQHQDPHRKSECDVCGKVFTTNSILNTHKKKKHGRESS